MYNSGIATIRRMDDAITVGFTREIITTKPSRDDPHHFCQWMIFSTNPYWGPRLAHVQCAGPLHPATTIALSTMGWTACQALFVWGNDDE